MRKGISSLRFQESIYEATALRVLSYQQTSYKKNQTGFRAVKVALAKEQAAAICITIHS